jgi:hypothetical protein
LETRNDYGERKGREAAINTLKNMTTTTTITTSKQANKNELI